MSSQQDRGAALKRLLETAMDHHRGRRQDEFESVLDVEIRIVEENILCACADVYRKIFIVYLTVVTGRGHVQSVYRLHFNSQPLADEISDDE